MKNILLIISLFTTIFAHAQNETQDFKQRVDLIKDYKITIEDKKNSFDNLINSIKNYDHRNMIPRDNKLIDNSIIELENQKKSIQNNSAALSTTAIEKKIKELDKKYLFKKKYEEKQKRLKEIQSKPGVSKRFKKFIEHTMNNKYAKAGIAKASLFKNEKELALEFDELNKFLVREVNMYSANEVDIQKEAKKLKHKLSFPEKAIENINNSVKIKDTKEKQFLALKEDHKKVQYDVTIGEYESGLFNCKEHSKPKIKRYKEFPHLFALITNGSVKSILNISSINPNTKDFIYKCSKFSSMGTCIENRKKEICKIQEDCANALTKMEDSFDLDKEFLGNRAGMLDMLSQKRKDAVNKGTALDILGEFDKEGRLGKISRANYNTMFEKMKTFAKSTDFSSSSDYTKKMKSKIEKQRKLLVKKYAGDKNTVNSLEYFHNNMLSFFKNAIEVDRLQEYIGSRCTSGEFCNDYKAWDKATAVFNEMEDIENLTEDECPRIVLRFGADNYIQSSYTCDRSQGGINFNEMNFLDKSSQKIIKKLK